MKLPHLKKTDTTVYRLAKQEEKRQNEGIELIASENYASAAVLEAMSTVFNNKYSEGYPGKRYYGGNEIVDKIENLAIERAKKLFDAQHANVQPFSGGPANMCAYFGLLEVGDKILGMDLSHGGHLSHGSPINFSGKWFEFHFYGVDKKTQKLNYDEIAKLAKKIKPKLIIAGFTAYPRIIDFKKFRRIADSVGAYLMVDMSHFAGLVAGGVYPNPVKIADIVTTTTHKTLRGPRGGLILCKEKYAKQIDRAVFPMIQAGPHEHIIAAKAVCFSEASKSNFSKYAKQIIVNAKTLEKELKKYDFNLVSGGTDTHLILIDLRNKNITGKEAVILLDSIGLSTNKNMVPYDTGSPMNPSGLRLGTSCATTRGMKEKEIKKIANWINKAIENRDDKKILKNIKEEVKKMCKKFPIPGTV